MARLTKTGALTLSLALNAGLLALMSLEERRPTQRRIPTSGPVYIDMEPVVVSASTPFATSSKAGVEDRILNDRPRADPASPRRFEGIAAASPNGARSDPPPSPAYDPQWTVRRQSSVGTTWPRESPDRTDAPVCAHPDRMPLDGGVVCDAPAVLEAGPWAPLIRTGDARTAAFEKEAAVKKRWRDYREGDGPYPGLRSLLGMN